MLYSTKPMNNLKPQHAISKHITKHGFFLLLHKLGLVALSVLTQTQPESKGGVPGLALRGSPPQTPPTETLPDLGLVQGRREAPQRRHNDLADQRPRRRRPVPVEARGTPVPASTTAIAGPRDRRAAPRRLRLPRLHPQLDRRDDSHRHQLVHCTASS